MQFEWPAFFGNGRADVVEKHAWAKNAQQPDDPARWLYICGPASAAEQIRAVAGGRCCPCKVPESLTHEYSHCFEFPNGHDSDVESLVQVLEQVRTLATRPHTDFALVLDWYKVPPEDGAVSPKWANTPSGELIYRGKYCKQRDRALQLVDVMTDVFVRHPLMRDATIVTVPGSKPHEGPSFGERLAGTIRKRTGNPMVLTVGAREGHAPRKGDEGHAHSLIGTLSMPQPIGGAVVVIDDVVRSGDSISAVALAARTAGATAVYALAAVKTMKDR